MPETNAEPIYIMQIAKRVIVKGKVQGVGYRAWTLRTAQKIGLSGWVKNLSDGSVEAFFQGHENQVSQMIKSCYQGPSFSKVHTVEELVENLGQEIADFLILD